MQQELLEKAFRRTTYNFISYRKYKSRITKNVIKIKKRKTKTVENSSNITHNKLFWFTLNSENNAMNVSSVETIVW